MPGSLLHEGAIVKCAHAGTGQPTSVYARVLVMGQPIVLQPTPFVIAGCGLPTPPTANGPCVSAQFVSAATRVFASVAIPVLLSDSQAICAPTCTPVMISGFQPRVVGT